GRIDRKADLVVEPQRLVRRHGFFCHFAFLSRFPPILGRAAAAFNCEQLNVRPCLLYCVQSSCAQYMIIQTRGERPMPVNVLYKTQAKATGGRDGHAATLDGALDVKLATPKELGGGGGAGNNPEQLFAAGYAACFIGAMKFVASQGGPKVPADASVTSTVGIGPRSAGGFGLDVELAVSLPGVPKADA